MAVYGRFAPGLTCEENLFLTKTGRCGLQWRLLWGLSVICKPSDKNGVRSDALFVLFARSNVSKFIFKNRQQTHFLRCNYKKAFWSKKTVTIGFLFTFTNGIVIFAQNFREKRDWYRRSANDPPGGALFRSALPRWCRIRGTIWLRSWLAAALGSSYLVYFFASRGIASLHFGKHFFSVHGTSCLPAALHTHTLFHLPLSSF